MITAIEHRVNYSETDQMGLVYHANYVIWLDLARTEHLRGTGVTYKEMEEQGVYLAVTDLQVRYRRAARYDDLVRVRCWVREVASRRVTFGYAVEREGTAATAELLATAQTSLMALDRGHSPTRIPEHVRELLAPSSDPVRL
ncbi:MAG TPA: thioesterase family protein [Gemmatimonadales bacterium]|nr:thioesterase family protein [Gemmatimonadales bacterium]